MEQLQSLAPKRVHRLSKHVLCQRQRTLNRLSVSETSDSGHRVFANSGAMEDKEETECKEAEQVDVEEKSKKKKKKKKRKHDNERDPNTQDIKDEQLSDKQEKSVRQSIDSKNSESGNGIAINSSSMKGKKKTKCKDAEQSETGESDHRITNSGAMEDKEKTKCKDDEQTEEERSKKKKKKKKRKVEDDNEEKDSCIRDGGDELSNKQLKSVGLKQAEVEKNSESDHHRATNSGALKNQEKIECKDAGQIEVANKKKKKKRKSRVQEDDDENDSCTRSRDEDQSEFRQDTESSDVVNKGIEKTKCKNDAKKKKKERKREECSDEAEGVLNDADDYCTEGQEGPGKKTKISKDNGITENKKSKKSTEKPDLSEEKAWLPFGNITFTVANARPGELLVICWVKDEAGDSQWQSAEFGDTSQKEKFLRLMGAYKPCNKERSASSYSVMAMNKQQEKAFSFSLEKQFVHAMQTRKERGTGLGYQ